MILDKLVSPFDFGVIQNSEVLLNSLDFLAVFDFMACDLGRFLTTEELSWAHRIELELITQWLASRCIYDSSF